MCSACRPHRVRRSSGRRRIDFRPCRNRQSRELPKPPPPNPGVAEPALAKPRTSKTAAAESRVTKAAAAKPAASQAAHTAKAQPPKPEPPKPLEPKPPPPMPLLPNADMPPERIWAKTSPGCREDDGDHGTDREKSGQHGTSPPRKARGKGPQSFILSGYSGYNASQVFARRGEFSLKNAHLNGKNRRRKIFRPSPAILVTQELHHASARHPAVVHVCSDYCPCGVLAAMLVLLVVCRDGPGRTPFGDEAVSGRVGRLRADHERQRLGRKKCSRPRLAGCSRIRSSSRSLKTSTAKRANCMPSEAEGKLGLSWDDLKKLPKGEVAFAVVARPEKRPALLLLVDQGDEASVADKLVDKVLDIAQEKGGEFSTEKIGDVEVTVVRDRDRENRMFGVCQRENTIIVATDPNVIRGVLWHWDHPGNEGGGDAASAG